MSTNKFDYYYQKVIDIQRAGKRGYDLFPWEVKAVTDGLNNILNANYEHILTDSFLDYLSHDSTVGFNFQHLAEDENAVLFIIFHYIESILGQYMFSLDNRKSKFGFVNLLEGDMKQATHDVYHFREKNISYKIDNIVFAILAYCFMNNKMNCFNEYFTIITNNLKEILEQSESYKVFDGPNGWYDFIKTTIDDHNEKKKVIK